MSRLNILNGGRRSVLVPTQTSSAPASTVTASGGYKALFLGAGAQMQCGVGQFTRLSGKAIERLDPGRSTTLTLTRSEGSVAEIWHAIGSAQSVVCNYPIVAWKRVIIPPILALAIARLRRRRAILILHEWRSLHALRRVTYLPALLLANAIVTFSPQVRQELAGTPLIGWTAKKSVLAPLPPNIKAPPDIADSALRRQLAAARQDGRLVIGHFGSIYPGKQPNKLLDIAALLKEREHRPLVIYVGSFIKGFDNVEQDFHSHVKQLGLSEDIIVSGYVASDAEIFGLFSEIDAFCYPLEEGITARRSSILASVQSDRPVIVTGPARTDEFDHHPRFRALIDRGAISLVPRGSPSEAYANRILQAIETPAVKSQFDFEGWWQDLARSIDSELQAATP